MALCKLKVYVNPEDSKVLLNGIEQKEIEVEQGTTVAWNISHAGYLNDIGEIKLDGSFSLSVSLTLKGKRNSKNTYKKIYKEEGQYVAEEIELSSNKIPAVTPDKKGKVLTVIEGNYIDWRDGSSSEQDVDELKQKIENLSASVEQKADKSSLDNLSENKANKSTTLSGYGIEDAYTKEEIDSKINAVLTYKGQVDSEANLPKEAKIGDVYNVIDSGANYAFDGKEWDKLSETIDLSLYAKKEEISSVYETIANASETKTLLENSLNEEISRAKNEENSIKGLVNLKAAQTSLDSLKQEVEQKANRSELEPVPTKVSELENDSGFLTEHQSLENLATKEEVKKEKEDLTSIINEKADKAALSKVSASSESVLSRMTTLEERLSQMGKTDIESVEISSTEPTTLNDETKDYVVTGEVQANLTASGKSVDLKGVTISNNARLVLTPTKETRLLNNTISGEFPKSGGNALITIRESDYVTVKDLTFDGTASCYNCVEIGLTGSNLPKNVLIDSCNFIGTLSNVSILVFGTQDNAVININNCKFENVSNVLRLSNRTNAKNIVVNMTNCDITKWDSTPLWAGAIILQDYTSKDVNEYKENNLFGNGKITININNCTYAGKKIVAGNPKEQFGSMDAEKQIVYIWCEKDTEHDQGLLPYEASRYPAINIL